MIDDITLADVKRKHKCCKCKKILYKDNKRLQVGILESNVQPRKYCLSCGLKYIEKKVLDWTKVANKIREKYTRQIIADRMGVENAYKRQNCK